MLIEKSVVDIADNSGALSVMLFAVNGKNGRKSVGVGSIVKGSVRKASVGGKIGRREKVHVLIVATKRKIQRKDGSSIRFSKNYGIIINKNNKEPIATRILTPISREIKDLGFNKVASLATEVL
jgi:large subunit ribosomal protein L14